MPGRIVTQANQGIDTIHFRVARRIDNELIDDLPLPEIVARHFCFDGQPIAHAGCITRTNCSVPPGLPPLPRT